ncbi:MAG: hypothetical protein WKG01_23035 [Kofleriaceae bacterium]
MRSMPSAVVIVALLAQATQAQPGQTQPQPYPPPAQPYPAQPAPYAQPYQPPGPGHGVPPPYGYPPVQLSPEDHALLADGEISEGAHIGGAAMNILFGFGLGQAIQGRFDDTGWIFALGGGASVAAMIFGAVRLAEDCSFSNDCDDSKGAGLMLVGLVGFTVFHTWGLVDSITGPIRHNRRVRDLRIRLGMRPMYSVMPFVRETRDGGGVAGLSLRF